MSEILATYRVKTRESETDVAVEQLEDDLVKLTLPDQSDNWGIKPHVELNPDELTALMQCLSLAGGHGDYDA